MSYTRRDTVLYRRAGLASDAAPYVGQRDEK